MSFLFCHPLLQNLFNISTIDGFRVTPHWRVEKQVADAQTLSTVVRLDADAREGEIARMLSGDTITAEARAAARALLTG